MTESGRNPRLLRTVSGVFGVIVVTFSGSVLPWPVIKPRKLELELLVCVDKGELVICLEMDLRRCGENGCDLPISVVGVEDTGASSCSEKHCEAGLELL